jgi:hypothetical protein
MFLRDLLNATYCWQLESTNREVSNFPCIDLIDRGRKIGVQISSDTGSGKINDTLKCINRHKLSQQIESLKVFLLLPRQDSYSVTVSCPGVAFRWEVDVIDFDRILKEATNCSLVQLQNIRGIVVNSLPSVFSNRLQPPQRSDSPFRIHTHRNTTECVEQSRCHDYGTPQTPAWLAATPERMCDPWLVEKLTQGANLKLFLDPHWGEGTWMVVDMLAREGVVINCDQRRDLQGPSPTTTTSTTPAPTPPKED